MVLIPLKSPSGFNMNSRGWNPRYRTNLYATPQGVEHNSNGKSQLTQIHFYSICNHGFMVQFTAQFFELSVYSHSTLVRVGSEYNLYRGLSPTAIHIQSRWDFNMRNIIFFRFLKNSNKFG